MVFHDLIVVSETNRGALPAATKANLAYLRNHARSDTPLTEMETGEIQIVSTAGGTKPDSFRYCTLGRATDLTIVKLGDAGIRFDENVIRCELSGLASATDETIAVIIPDTALKRTVRRARVVSSATTTSTGVDHWVIDLQDRALAGGAGVSLLTATLDTNGSDFVAWVPQTLAIDTTAEANVLAHSRVLTFKATKNGSPTAIPHLVLILELEGQ